MAFLTLRTDHTDQKESRESTKTPPPFAEVLRKVRMAVGAQNSESSSLHFGESESFGYQGKFDLFAVNKRKQ